MIKTNKSLTVFFASSLFSFSIRIQQWHSFFLFICFLFLFLFPIRKYIDICTKEIIIDEVFVDSCNIKNLLEWSTTTTMILSFFFVWRRNEEKEKKNWYSFLFAHSERKEPGGRAKLFFSSSFCVVILWEKEREKKGALTSNSLNKQIEKSRLLARRAKKKEKENLMCL